MPRDAIGSVKPHGDGWIVRIDTGRDPVTGKRTSRSRVVRGSRREAESVRVRMLAEAGRMPDQSCRVTLREMVEGMWLPSCREHLRADTVAGYAGAMRSSVLPAIGDVRLDELRPSHIDAMLARIPTQGARKKAYATLRAALRWALRRRIVPSVATDAVDPPRASGYEPETLSASEASALIAAFRGSPVEAGVLMALGTGMRRSEVCALDWEDVDLQRREASVTKRYLIIGGKPDMGEPKTRNSRRIVSIPASFAARLAEIRPDADGDGTHPLMESPRVKGGRMPPDTFSQIYRRTVERAGLRYVPLKNLRHSHATIMLESGVDVVTVSRRLGHASVSTTDRFYLRPRRAADEKAAESFDMLGIVR